MATGPRNVVWIMCDQLSWLALAAYGGPHAVETPAIDRLAREGIVFDNCYTPSPVCVPARFAQLSGRYPHRTGCVGNRTPLPLACRTAAHRFAQSGYVTGFVGKMHPVDAQTHGFDVLVDFGHYFDYLGPRTGVFGGHMGATDAGCGVPWVDAYTAGRNPWKGVALHPDLPTLLDEADHPDSFFAREAERFLHQYGVTGDRAAPPFFLFVSFLRPHRPFAPPARFATRYTAERVQLPPPPVGYDRERVPAQARHREIRGAFTPEGDAEARTWIAGYCGNVAHVDACVGHVLGVLDELSLTDNTLLVFMADHGDMLYDHGLVAKFTFFEGSCRVPCVVRWAGNPTPGRRLGDVVDLTDLLPTSLEALGLPVPEGLDGRSLWGACLPGAGTRPKGYALSSLALDSSRPMYMLRRDRWKYNRYVDGVELYDLTEDPSEFHNLAGDPGRRTVTAELDAEMRALLGDEAVACLQSGRPLPWANRLGRVGP